MGRKLQFYFLSLIFYGLPIVCFLIVAVSVMLLLTLIFGPASGLSVFFYAIVGSIVGIVGGVIGSVGAYVNIKRFSKKWSSELGEEKTKLTCLSFLTFLALLAITILAVSRL